VNDVHHHCWALYGFLEFVHLVFMIAFPICWPFVSTAEDKVRLLNACVYHTLEWGGCLRDELTNHDNSIVSHTSSSLLDDQAWWPFEAQAAQGVCCVITWHPHIMFRSIYNN
jgi:hypothetical protein